MDLEGRFRAVEYPECATEAETEEFDQSPDD